MKRLIFIIAIVFCSCGAQKPNSAGTVLSNSAAYRTAMEAIEFRDFAMVADLISSPYGNNSDPDPRDTYISLRGGEDGHFQVGMQGFVIDGPASNIRTKVRNNGDVEVSMLITSKLSSINSVTVNITMKSGSNKAAASIFLERQTYKTTFSMTGRIYPIEGLTLFSAPERLQIGNFMNPFSYN